MAVKRHLTSAAFLVLAVLGSYSGAGADQTNFDIDVRELRPHPSVASTPPGDGFEIDLKELHRAPADSKPSSRRIRRSVPPARATAETAAAEGTSGYTVKAGDFLFLILMREYGLSNDAAERLIPEVMRRNGIRSPQGLTVGQRLTIPLPPPGDAPKPVARSTAPQPPAPAERRVSVAAAPPCQLARAVVEQLGLAAAPPGPRPNGTAFAAASAGLKLVVACGLTPEEAYTYGRLLVFRHARLLTFRGDEPPDRVIEEVAEQLGVSFRLADPAAAGSLPLGYIFPAGGTDGREVWLTILPATGAASP
ncbi:MAG TPA: LysM peptidoglycan-binding domain-containing protein [Desulfuromonadaceae bacterium]